MKKTFALVICCFSIGCAGSVFAADYSATNGAALTMGTGAAVGTTYTAAQNPTLVQQASNTVSMSYRVDATGSNFIIASAHGQGTRNFQTSSNDSKIMWSQGTGITLQTLPASGTSVSWPTGWTAL